MHTFTHTDDFGIKTTFHYNSDLSGNVEIVPHVHNDAGIVGQRVDASYLSVPGEALLAFVAEHVRRERIAFLEDGNALEDFSWPCLKD